MTTALENQETISGFFTSVADLVPPWIKKREEVGTFLGSLLQSYQRIGLGSLGHSTDIEKIEWLSSPEILNNLAAGGLKHFAIEIPHEMQKAFDRYTSGEIELDTALKEIHALPRETLEDFTLRPIETLNQPEHKEKFDTFLTKFLEFAKKYEESGVKIHLIDNNKPSHVFKRVQDVIKLKPDWENEFQAALRNGLIDLSAVDFSFADEKTYEAMEFLFKKPEWQMAFARHAFFRKKLETLSPESPEYTVLDPLVREYNRNDDSHWNRLLEKRGVTPNAPMAFFIGLGHLFGPKGIDELQGGDRKFAVIEFYANTMEYNSWEYSRKHGRHKNSDQDPPHYKIIMDSAEIIDGPKAKPEDQAPEL